MPSFDLIDQPWLPCRFPSGEARDVGLREALARAHEIAELRDNSPLVTVSLHRLLLALLHRAQRGPETLADWTALWRAGGWDGAVIDAYLDMWRDRFDLFHAETPFYQVPFMVGANLLPAAQLAPEAASGNNPTLFDHARNAEPAPVAAAVVARRLVAQQAFAFGGGVSKPFNLSDSPLIRDYTILAFGDTLFETLALNLLVVTAERPLPRDPDDRPAWEKDAPRAADRNGTRPRGYLDYLTWQSRRVHLVAEGDGELVRWCQLQQGYKLPVPAPDDPFKAYRKDPRQGRFARKLNPDRAVWRDSHALLSHASDVSERPPLFDHLALISERGITGKEDYRFGIFGLATVPGRASVILWRQEQLPLPLAYLAESDESRDLLTLLDTGLRHAEEAGQALRAGVWRLAQLLLARTADLPDGRQPPQEVIKARAAHFGAERDYWGRLETAFARFLVDLPRDLAADPKTTAGYGGPACDAWDAAIRGAATDAFDQIGNGLSGTAWELKAAVKAGWTFRQRLEVALRGDASDVLSAGDTTDTIEEVSA